MEPVAFLRDALTPVFARRMVLPVILLTLLLTATNIVLARNVPPAGQAPSLPFILAGFVRIAGLLLLAVVILRRLTESPRPGWRPDGAFWLYVLTALLSLGVSVGVAFLVGATSEPAALLARNMVSTVILAPFAVWFVAIAVTRPLALRPGPWMRDYWAWLPQLLLWMLLLVAPLGALHAWLDEWLVRGAGGLFWPIALFDGALSVVIVLLGAGLQVAAYRRVARG
jgi:hypothetical protein